jgi:hypothetical protein
LMELILQSLQRLQTEELEFTNTANSKHKICLLKK